MSQKFDLTDALKRQILSSARCAVGGMAAVTIKAYDVHYGDFGTLQGADLVWGLAAGVLVSVAWEGTGQVVRQIAGGMAQGRAARVKMSRPYAHLGQAPVSPSGDGRTIKVSSARETRNLAFTYQQPSHINRETPGEMVKRWGKRWGKRWWGRDEVRPLAQPPPSLMRRPPEMEEFKFSSYDQHGDWIQLLGGDVWNFLKIAWRKRAGGSGLGVRRWGYRGRGEWPPWYHGLETPWYWAVLRLLDEAERMTGVQLVLKSGNHWKRLKYDNRRVYDLLCAAEQSKRLDI